MNFDQFRIVASIISLLISVHGQVVTL